jgi:hypothetical protein
MEQQYRIEKIVYPGTRPEDTRTVYFPQYSYKSFFTKKIKWANFKYIEYDDDGCGHYSHYKTVRKFTNLADARTFLDDLVAQKSPAISTILDYP